MKKLLLCVIILSLCLSVSSCSYIGDELPGTDPDPLLISDTSKEHAVKVANIKAAEFLDDCVLENNSVAEWSLGEGLNINIAQMRYGERNVYYPAWIYYEDGRWNCAPIFYTGNEMFNDDGVSAANSFVSKIGEYTIIYLSEYDFYRLEEGQFGDSLQTKPTALEYRATEKLCEEGWWYFVLSDRNGNYGGTQVSINTDLRGLIYAIKDMPDNYVFQCGEETLTAEEIRNLLSK